MALNLKDLAKKPAPGQRTEAASAQGKTAGRPWEVQAWEKPAEPKPSEEAATTATSDEPAQAEAAEALAAPDSAQDTAQETAGEAVGDAGAGNAEMMDSAAAEALAAASAESEPEEAPHRGEERRGYSDEADETDPNVGVDDVLAFVEELKVKLRNSQRSKRGIEEVLAATKSKMDELEQISAGRAREIVQLHQEVAKLKGECERQLAELCRGDDDRSEAGLALKRLSVNLNDARTQVRAREEEIARLKLALANNRKMTAEREQLAAAAEAENVQRWRKFEDQLNNKDRELFKARATIDELRQQKDQAEARIARLEGSRAAIERIRAAVQAGRERRGSDTDT